MPSVPLKDLADISVGDERTSISKTNGKDAVNLQIMKSQDANTVQVARSSEKVDEFVRNESGMKSIKTMDTAKPIEDSLYTMVEKALSVRLLLLLLFFCFKKHKNYSYFNCIYTNVNINCAHSIKIKQRIIKYSYFRCINGCNRASYR